MPNLWHLDVSTDERDQRTEQCCSLFHQCTFFDHMRLTVDDWNHKNCAGSKYFIFFSVFWIWLDHFGWRELRPDYTVEFSRNSTIMCDFVFITLWLDYWCAFKLRHWSSTQTHTHTLREVLRKGLMIKIKDERESGVLALGRGSIHYALVCHYMPRGFDTCMRWMLSVFYLFIFYFGDSDCAKTIYNYLI